MELVQRVIDAVHARDFDAVQSAYAPNAVLDILQLGATFEGHLAIRGFYEEWAATFPGWKQEVQEILDLGDGMGFAVVAQAGHPGDSTGFRPHVRQLYALDVAGDREILEDEFDEFPPPDMDAIRTALDAKTLKECASCGETDWSLPPGTNMIAAGARPDGEIDMDLAFEVVAVICQSCGFVRMHHVGRLLD